jgi:alkanesulfonate monooxygenase SsuD/methylene tetrahydromethanopterin reductase-like flavin-dependent oxidoreductase (luciferase family)
MDFCIGTCAKIDQVDLVKRAEDLGVTHFGVGEGPLLFSDPYQQLALAARATSSINLGTMVTNPLTRIAPVTANSVATLNTLAPGRTFMGIGTANNALRSMGNRPATIRELTQAVNVTRGLLRGERIEHEWRGEQTEVEFLDRNGHWYDVKDVPIWISGGGPRSIRAAAQVADALVYCLGPQPEMIRLVRHELDKAVADAGREPGSVKLISLSWFYLLRNSETWEDAITAGFGSGPISSCITNAGFMQKHPDQLGEPIISASTQAAMAYLGDPSASDQPHYLDTWAKYLRGLDPAHKPLITKELVDYWCLYGSADDIREKAQLMLDNGVDLLSVFLSNPFTAERDINDIGATVLAA